MNVNTVGEVQFARTRVRTVSTDPTVDSAAHARTVERVTLILEIAGTSGVYKLALIGSVCGLTT